MKYSDIADLLSGAGAFLVGIAAVITSLKAKEKEPKRKATKRKR
ncbi:MAG: hypothetical protein SPF57_02790 [Streptococcus orisratti]|nr:hypothetical protein [Streptococcus orisratti]MDY4001012.1 hypothetical protein [Streptococcus orisratti]MDY5635272.1 hypothetical protein [Streptococcus orisratti]